MENEKTNVDFETLFLNELDRLNFEISKIDIPEFLNGALSYFSDIKISETIADKENLNPDNLDLFRKIFVLGIAYGFSFPKI